ncbi:hypothetical protein BH11ACT3_BH11ACT3_23560 [soil metagenome]
MTYTVRATIEVDITNQSAFNAVAALNGGGDDEQAKIQSALDAGLGELTRLASRYGFTITNSSATVEQVEPS